MSRIRIRTMSIVAAVLVATTAAGAVAPAAQAAPRHSNAILWAILYGRVEAARTAPTGSPPPGGRSAVPGARTRLGRPVWTGVTS